MGEASVRKSGDPHVGANEQRVSEASRAGFTTEHVFRSRDVVMQW